MHNIVDVHAKGVDRGIIAVSMTGAVGPAFFTWEMGDMFFDDLGKHAACSVLFFLFSFSDGVDGHCRPSEATSTSAS